jgi:hypothetical protein
MVRRCRAFANEMRKVLSLLFALAAWLVTPYLPFFHYGDPEIRAAVEGTWRLDVGPRSVTFTIEQATHAEQNASRGWIRSAAACGDYRTLIRTAEACVDEVRTDMPLVVTAVSGALGRGTGQFFVHGYNFRTGGIRAELDGLVIFATIDREGHAEQARVFDKSEHEAVAALVRISVPRARTSEDWFSGRFWK